MKPQWTAQARLWIDFSLVATIIVTVANKATGSLIHEYAGLGVGLLALAHSIVNWRWYTTMFRAGDGWRYKTNSIITLLLVTTVAVVLVSGIMISREGFSFLNIDGTFLVRQVHVTATYWFFMLSALHLGIQWKRFATALTKTLPVLSRLRVPGWVGLVVRLMIFGGGTTAFWQREIWTKLFAVYAFDAWGEEQSLVRFAIDNLTIMAAFSTLAHLAYRGAIPSWSNQMRSRERT